MGSPFGSTEKMIGPCDKQGREEECRNPSPEGKAPGGAWIKG